MELLSVACSELPPEAFLALHGEVFARFDAATQDSGNVSYGVRVGAERLFVKTAGAPHGGGAALTYAERVELLRNAVRLRRSLQHSALPALRHVIESGEGPLLVYEWVDGELIRTAPAQRSDPTSPYARFLALPIAERAAAMDAVLHVHAALGRLGWIACDFYDGCLIYDFARRVLRVIDLDHYRDAPFVNELGRMFGSSRFMAPEEHTLGARIDQRTTVFNLGRALQLFLADEPRVQAIAERACQSDPRERYASSEQLWSVWSQIAAALLRGPG